MLCNLQQADTLVFDLDGTLLSTLEDLADATNFALSKYGYRQRTLDEICSFVGNGVRKLIERALPDNVNAEIIDEVLECFKSYYVTHCMVKTCPYDGIIELLRTLKERGYKTAIVSNKLQSGVEELWRHYFSGLIDVAVGERPEIPAKPSPQMIYQALSELGSEKEKAVYIGDSDVDIDAACNAGLPCISVLWGFRDKDFLKKHGAFLFAESPMQILDIITSDNQFSRE